MLTGSRFLWGKRLLNVPFGFDGRALMTLTSSLFGMRRLSIWDTQLSSSIGVWLSSYSTSGAILLVQQMVSVRDRQHHGTARWARVDEMRRAGYLQRYSRISGPVFGKTSGPFWSDYYLTNSEQPHSLIVAPTRAGKGVGIVIPTLLTYEGSVIALRR